MHEYRRLVSRRNNAGAKTDPAYIRAAVLTGAEFQMPAFETQRDLRNAIIQITSVLQSLPPGKLRNEALTEAKATLSRVCR